LRFLDYFLYFSLQKDSLEEQKLIFFFYFLHLLISLFYLAIVTIGSVCNLHFRCAVMRAQMGTDIHGRPHAVGMRNGAAIDPDERDV